MLERGIIKRGVYQREELTTGGLIRERAREGRLLENGGAYYKKKLLKRGLLERETYYRETLIRRMSHLSITLYRSLTIEIKINININTDLNFNIRLYKPL